MAKNEVSSNPTLVSWPSDKYGVAVELKRALVHAGSRINGHDDKFEVIMETLRVGAQHIKARLGAQKATNASMIAARLAKQAAQPVNRGPMQAGDL